METIQNRVIRGPVIFYIYYFIFYSNSAIQGSFLTLFLTESGIPVGTPGLINGTIQILSLFVFPMFGRIADWAPTKNRVHCALLSCSIAVLFLMTGIRKVVMFCIFRILFVVFYSPITSIEETITLEYCSRNS